MEVQVLDVFLSSSSEEDEHEYESCLEITIRYMEVQVLDVFLSSSSEEDEHEYEEIDLLQNNCRCHYRVRIPRIQNYIEMVVDAYNEYDFQHFRVRRTTFEYLINVLGHHLQSVNPSGTRQISPRTQLLIALWYLGTPDSHRSVTDKFGVGCATAWRTVDRVVAALYIYRNYYIRWPDEQEIRTTVANILRDWGVPGVLGFLDGTHIKIPRPKVQPEAYYNRKHYPSFQLQVICGYFLKFYHCYAGLPGSVHDMRVFRYSGLQQMCSPPFFPPNTHLLADSAYTLQENVLTPYRDTGHRTLEQIYFNRCVSGARATVERSIGLLKLRWRILLDKCPIKTMEMQPFVIFACCILHNVCLLQDEELILPVIAPEMGDDDGLLFPTRNQQLRGHHKREDLCFRLANNI